MTTSRSFDRAASYYDQTRSLPDPVAREGIQAILDVVGTGTRLLEVGAGTGRISIPLLERGVDLMGCDLSSNMLRRLHEKHPLSRIAQADASYLPFPGASFDFVMTVHVLHLVPSWREVLREFKRVLRPTGAYLNVKTWAAAGVSIRDEMRRHWQAWLETQGVNARQLGVQNDAEFRQELETIGARVSETEVIRYPVVFTLRQQLERYASRILSDTWEVPDAVFDASMAELRFWTEQEYGDLDRSHQDELRFAIEIARFEKA